MYNTRLVFYSACIGMLLFGSGLITLGAVAPELKEKFQLDDISSGTLFSILPLGILAGSLLFGPLCDRYGYRILLGISSLLMFAGFEGIAFSRSLGVLKICIFFFGFGGGSINGGTNAVVADISANKKGANLSLLGVFFGLGALSMPFILGVLKSIFSSEGIVATVGIFALPAAFFFFIIKFPPPKQNQEFPLKKIMELLKDKVLLLIAFFLFCQSSFEGIINNWTTFYLIQHLGIEEKKALYALSLYLVGMTTMRLLSGSIFRTVPPKKLLVASFFLILSGCIFLKSGNTFATSSNCSEFVINLENSS